MLRSPRRLRTLALVIASCLVLQWTSASLARAGNGHVGHRAQCSCVQCRDRDQGQPDLFANYYVPGTCGGVPAEMYLAPHPVPPVVGYTYYTYQPMMPHELLYQHHRTYYRYYDNGRGLTRTSVHWYRPPLQSSLVSLRGHFTLAR